MSSGRVPRRVKDEIIYKGMWCHSCGSVYDVDEQRRACYVCGTVLQEIDIKHPPGHKYL